MPDYQLLFGDSYTDLHSPRMREPGYLDAVLRQARELLGFGPIAYYLQEYHEVKGFGLEDWLPEATPTPETSAMGDCGNLRRVNTAAWWRLFASKRCSRRNSVSRYRVPSVHSS